MVLPAEGNPVSQMTNGLGMDLNVMFFAKIELIGVMQSLYLNIKKAGANSRFFKNQLVNDLVFKNVLP